MWSPGVVGRAFRGPLPVERSRSELLDMKSLMRRFDLARLVLIRGGTCRPDLDSPCEVARARPSGKRRAPDGRCAGRSPFLARRCRRTTLQQQAERADDDDQARLG